MNWRLHVRFQELSLRDAYWEQAIAMPQLMPMLMARELRTRLYLARPEVAFEHNDRAALAPLARWTLDFWPSTQISLEVGERSLQAAPEEPDLRLET